MKIAIIRTKDADSNDKCKSIKNDISFEQYVIQACEFNDCKNLLESHICNNQSYDYVALPKQFIEKLVKQVMFINKENKKLEGLHFKTKCGIIRLNINEIVYVELTNRKLHVITIDECYEVIFKRFEDIVKKFESKDFVQINRGCIVNMMHIKLIDKKEVIIYNNNKLCISRYRSTKVHSKYINYLKNLDIN